MKEFPSAFVETLAEIVGRENVICEKEDLFPYFPDLLGLVENKEFVMVFPRTEAEVCRLVMFAQENGLRIVPRGAGTSLRAKPLPIDNSLMVNFIRMNRVIEIDERNLMVRVEPGVTIAEIQSALKDKNLWYPIEPATMISPTIGGCVAENANGLRSFKYGVTADYVMGLRMVTADGEVLSSGRKAIKDVAGYNLAKFIVGSQGSLGLITEVLLEVLPQPGARLVEVAYLPDNICLAAEIVSQILSNKILPAMLEFLDGEALHALEEYLDIKFPEGTKTLLIIELDGHPSVVEESGNTIHNICKEKDAIEIKRFTEPVAASEPYLWLKSAFSALASLRPITLLMGLDCPSEEMADLSESIKNISESFNLLSGVFGNIGGGYLYLTIGAESNNPEELNKLNNALDEIYRVVVDMRARISHLYSSPETESFKIPMIQPMISGKEIEIMRKIKKSFDPNEVFHSGKLIL